MQVSYCYGQALAQAKTPRRRKPKFDHDEARRLRARGSTIADLARRFGVSYSAVYSAVSGVQVPRRQGIARRVDYDAAMDLVRSGLTLAEVGRRFGVSRERIRQIAAAHTVKPGHGRVSKAEQRLAVERLLLDGRPDSEVAAETGATPFMIGSARSRLGLGKVAERRRALAPYLEMVRNGRSIRSVAREFGISGWSLREAGLRAGVRSVAGSCWKDLSGRRDVVLALRADGASWSDVAARVNEIEGQKIGRQAVYKWSRKYLPELFGSG